MIRHLPGALGYRISQTLHEIEIFAIPRVWVPLRCCKGYGVHLRHTGFCWRQLLTQRSELLARFVKNDLYIGLETYIVMIRCIYIYIYVNVKHSTRSVFWADGCVCYRITSSKTVSLLSCPARWPDRAILACAPRRTPVA